MQFDFPKDSDDPKKKEGKEWIKAFCEAALGNYGNMPQGTLGFRSRDRYEKNKLYSLGKQSVTKYQTIFNNGDDGEKSLLVTDWAIRPEIKKLRRIVTSLVSEMPFKIQINPIDDLAKGEMEDELARQEAKLLARQALAELGDEESLNLPVFKTYGDEAKDFGELQVKELGIRHATAKDTEMLVELVFNANQYTFTIDQLVEDAFDTGLAIVQDYTIDDKTVGIQRVDPRDLLISYCRNPDFSDWKYVGQIKRIPATKLLAMGSGQFTKEDVDRIYELGQYGTQYGLGLVYGNYNSISEFYAKGYVYIVDIEIRSTDTVTLEERELKNGTKIYAKGNPTKKSPNKIGEKTIENIYCGKWVVGTDIMFDYGKKRNMKRDALNEACVKSSYHITACDFYDMTTTSRAEELTPYADAIQMAVYKLSNALNRAVPSGFNINLDALEAVDLGAGGANGKMTPSDLLDLYVQRGVLVSRTISLDGGKSLPKAIEMLPSSVGSDVVEFRNTIIENRQGMRESLGLNDLTDGSTPNPKTLTEIAKAATAGTNNALGDLFKMQRKLYQSLTESIIIRSQDIIKYGNDKYLVNALGAGSIKLLKNIKDIGKYIYSVAIEDNPSQDDLLSFQNQLAIAQTNKEVTIADVMMLDNIDNLKQKQAYLTYAVGKNIALQQKQALEREQMNGQIQVQSAEAAEAARQQTLQIEYQLKTEYELTKIAAEKDKDVTIENVRLEGKRIDATGRVESAAEQAEGRDIANKRDNIVKLALAETPKDISIVENITPDKTKSTIEPRTAFGNELKIPEFNFLPEDDEIVEEQPMPQEEMPMQQMM